MTPTSVPSLVVELVDIDALHPDPANPRRISERGAGVPHPLDAPVGRRPAGARPP